MSTIARVEASNEVAMRGRRGPSGVTICEVRVRCVRSGCWSPTTPTGRLKCRSRRSTGSTFKPSESDLSKPASTPALAFACCPTRSYGQLARPWTTEPASEKPPANLVSPTRRSLDRWHVVTRRRNHHRAPHRKQALTRENAKGNPAPASRCWGRTRGPCVVSPLV